MHLKLSLAFVLVTIAAAQLASAAPAHPNGCHRKHSCPSDHATYKWNGWWCVARTADERNASFKQRLVYAKRVYFCKRAGAALIPPPAVKTQPGIIPPPGSDVQ